jgi:hypothetical protein
MSGETALCIVLAAVFGFVVVSLVLELVLDTVAAELVLLSVALSCVSVGNYRGIIKSHMYFCFPNWYDICHHF